MTFGEKLKSIRLSRKLSQQEFADMLGTSKQVVSRYELGQTTPKIGVAARWCELLGVNLDNMLNNNRDIYDDTQPINLPHGMESPTVTEDYVTFPVIGDLAAGFDHIMCEDWTGDKIDIPVSYLHGRPISDYFCLKVKGDSMYPLYMDGDRVLVLQAPTLQHSGDIGVVRYDGEMATLKKVEYADGEDWVRLVAINPNYPPHMITGCDLEQCSILGIPKLTLRET